MTSEYDKRIFNLRRTKSHGDCPRLEQRDPNSERSKEELEVSEARYRRLFEESKDGILIIDAGNGKVLDANPPLVDAIGYPRHEILNKSLWELGHPHARPERNGTI